MVALIDNMCPHLREPSDSTVECVARTPPRGYDGAYAASTRAFVIFAPLGRDRPAPYDDVLAAGEVSLLVVAARIIARSSASRAGSEQRTFETDITVRAEDEDVVATFKGLVCVASIAVAVAAFK